MAQVDLGGRRELFLDDFLVARMQGEARRAFHRPVPREVVLTFDQPWEGNTSAHATVFQDGGKYRMYYRASGYEIAGAKLEPPHPAFTAFAESDDGVRWTRPGLGVAEFQGTRKNNLLAERVEHVFQDANPDAPPEARYKAISKRSEPVGETGAKEHSLFAWQSADGIRWQKMQEAPIYGKGHRGLGGMSAEAVGMWLDSHNTAFWSPAEGRYVMYYRVFTFDGRLPSPGWQPDPELLKRRTRQAEKAVSEDFLHWERVGLVQCSGGFPSHEEQMYNNGIAPYARAPHIALGLPGRYSDRGWTASHDLLPDVERRKLESGVSLRSGTALTDTLLMWSRDGTNFTLSPETFLPPGPQRTGSWMYGDHWAAHHLVETAPSFSGAAPELSLYAKEFYRKGPASRLRRYSLRLDGFASVRAARQGGELLTRPLTFEGDRLAINFAASAAGHVRVEVQDAEGSPIPGRSLEDSDPMIGDDVDRAATWNGDAGLGRLAGRPVRLRFQLKDADLYALQFQGSGRTRPKAVDAGS